MAAWIISALSLIRGAFVGGRATALATGLALPDIPGVPGTGIFGGLFGGDGDGDQPRRRRRRRRALTASDRADIGFITGLLGPSAGKQFAVTIATRSS